jgi:hypothetical protein
VSGILFHPLAAHACSPVLSPVLSIPFFVEVGSSKSGVASLRVFRVVRLARVFRLFKMSRYNTYMKILLQALHKSKDAFYLLTFLIALGVGRPLCVLGVRNRLD